MSSQSPSQTAGSNSFPNAGSSGGLSAPLLPAFLLTGFFFAGAVLLMAWRYFRWQPATPSQGPRIVRRMVSRPRFWDVWVAGRQPPETQTTEVMRQQDIEQWGGIQPLSATVVPPLSPPLPAQTSKKKSNASSEKDSVTQMQVACLLAMPSQHSPSSSPTPDRYYTDTIPREYAIGTVDVGVQGQWRPYDINARS